MTYATWRDVARDVLTDMMAALPADATEKDVRRAIKAAYPFGERENLPYKIWCDEARRHLEARFPDVKRANQKAQLERALARRGGDAVAQMRENTPAETQPQPQLFEDTGDTA